MVGPEAESAVLKRLGQTLGNLCEQDDAEKAFLESIAAAEHAYGTDSPKTLGPSVFGESVPYACSAAAMLSRKAFSASSCSQRLPRVWPSLFNTADSASGPTIPILIFYRECLNNS